MNRLPVLIRKEFQEYKGMFIYLPLVLTALMLVVILSGLTFTGSMDLHKYDVYMSNTQNRSSSSNSDFIVMQPFSGAAMQRLAAASPERREEIISGALLGLSVPLLIALWIVTYVYPLGTLYAERKERSILFWKSMPVSDSETVISKLVCITLVVPAIYLLCIMFLQGVGLLVASISAMHASVPAMKTLVVPSHLLWHWFNEAGYLLLNSIWFLPLYAWLLLVSAWARTVPAVWALLVPFAIILLERIFTPWRWFGHWISSHGWPVGFSAHEGLNAVASYHLMLNGDMIFSLAMTAVMLYGAIYLRGRTDEI